MSPRRPTRRSGTRGTPPRCGSSCGASQPAPGSQLALFVHYSYHAFITDRAGELMENRGRPSPSRRDRERDPRPQVRRRAQPSPLGPLRRERGVARGAGDRAQPRRRWTVRLGLGEGIVTTRTLRRRYFALAGRLTHSARRWTLHLPRRWPWAGQLAAAPRATTGDTAPGLTPAHSADPGPSLAPARPRTPRAPALPMPSAPPSRAERPLLAPARPRHRPANAGTPAELSSSPASRPVKFRSVDSGLRQRSRGRGGQESSPASRVQDQSAREPPAAGRTPLGGAEKVAAVWQDGCGGGGIAWEAAPCEATPSVSPTSCWR